MVLTCTPRGIHGHTANSSPGFGHRRIPQDRQRIPPVSQCTCASTTLSPIAGLATSPPWATRTTPSIHQQLFESVTGSDENCSSDDHGREAGKLARRSRDWTTVESWSSMTKTCEQWCGKFGREDARRQTSARATGDAECEIEVTARHRPRSMLTVG